MLTYQEVSDLVKNAPKDDAARGVGVVAYVYDSSMKSAMLPRVQGGFGQSNA